LLLLLILDVMTYDIRGYLVPNRPNKIPITPEFSTPELFLHLWKLLEYHLSRDALYHLHNLCRRIPRRCRQKQMDMIILHLHRIYLKTIPLGYFLEGCLKPFCQFIPQYHLPIFGNPYHMIFQIIDRMTRSFYWAHARLIACFIAFGEPVFIRPAELGGIEQVFL